VDNFFLDLGTKTSTEGTQVVDTRGEHFYPTHTQDLI